MYIELQAEHLAPKRSGTQLYSKLGPSVVVWDLPSFLDEQGSNPTAANIFAAFYSINYENRYIRTILNYITNWILV